MASILRQRRATALEWSTANPVIPDGQMCFDTTNKLFKIGNGSATWTNLEAQSGIPGVGEVYNYRADAYNATLARMDYSFADTSGDDIQEDTINSFVVVNNTLYTITINGIDYSFTSSASATESEIIAGLVHEINVLETNGSVLVTATNMTTYIKLTSDISGQPYTTSVNGNMTLSSVIVNLGSFTLTLPINPVIGDRVAIADSKGTFGTNNLTVARNGETIMGLAEDIILNIDDLVYVFTYTGADWRISK